MTKKDEYLVYYSTKSGADFYYKNKKLHRETGPAVVILQDKALNYNLDDQKKYKRVTETVVEEIVFRSLVVDFNGKEKFTESPFSPPISLYYLEDVQYQKEEFDAVMLKKELTNYEEKNTTSKRVKV